MAYKKPNKFLKETFSFKGFVFVFIIFCGVVAFLNHEISKKAEEIDKKGAFTFSDEINKIDEQSKLLANKEVVNPGFLINEGKIVRRIRAGDRNITFMYSIIYHGNVQIAEFKEAAGKVYDFSGEIPDGEIEFENTTYGTYGTENYRNNKRDGMYFEYFKENNKVRIKARYYDGKILSSTEYDFEGTLMKEYQIMKEEPKVEEPKIEEIKAEEIKKEGPKVEVTDTQIK